ncbi:MAG: ABC transporter substrate-binding protein [Hyphomicrobiales bacterium]|nr:ABC transporter substrate-binding protein [Hyphomicrobiales bacterium]
MIDRRNVIGLLAGVAAAWPAFSSAQQAARVPRIGVLMGTAENEDGRTRLAAFRDALHQLGRRDAQIEVRWADGDEERAQRLARELIELRPRLLIGNSTTAARALQQHTADVPVVFIVVSDPVGDRLVASLAHPGGNITGFTGFEFSLAGKWLELLKETAPSIRRVAMLFNPTTAPGRGWPYVESAKTASRGLGFEVVPLPCSSAGQIESNLAEFAREPAGGAVTLPDSFTSAHAPTIVASASRHRIPTVYALRLFPLAGGLMSYGIDATAQFRQAASYADRIMRGEHPKDLPVQAPSNFELVINLKIAKQTGLEIAPLLLARADEVIE